MVWWKTWTGFWTLVLDLDLGLWTLDSIPCMKYAIHGVYIRFTMIVKTCHCYSMMENLDWALNMDLESEPGPGLWQFYEVYST